MSTLESDYQKLFRLLSVTRSPFATVSTVFADRLTLKINSCINDIVVIETNRTIANHLVDMLKLRIAMAGVDRPSVYSIAVSAVQWQTDLSKIEQVFRLYIKLVHSGTAEELDLELPTQRSNKCALLISDHHPQMSYPKPFVIQVWGHELFFDSYQDALTVQDNIESILSSLVQTVRTPIITAEIYLDGNSYRFEIGNIALRFNSLEDASALQDLYLKLHGAIRSKH